MDELKIEYYKCLLQQDYTIYLQRHMENGTLNEIKSLAEFSVKKWQLNLRPCVRLIRLPGKKSGKHTKRTPFELPNRKYNNKEKVNSNVKMVESKEQYRSMDPAEPFKINYALAEMSGNLQFAHSPTSPCTLSQPLDLSLPKHNTSNYLNATVLDLSTGSKTNQDSSSVSDPCNAAAQIFNNVPNTSKSIVNSTSNFEVVQNVAVPLVDLTVVCGVDFDVDDATTKEENDKNDKDVRKNSDVDEDSVEENLIKLFYSDGSDVEDSSRIQNAAKKREIKKTSRPNTTVLMPSVTELLKNLRLPNGSILESDFEYAMMRLMRESSLFVCRKKRQQRQNRKFSMEKNKELSLKKNKNVQSLNKRSTKTVKMKNLENTKMKKSKFMRKFITDNHKILNPTIVLCEKIDGMVVNHTGKFNREVQEQDEESSEITKGENGLRRSESELQNKSSQPILDFSILSDILRESVQPANLAVLPKTTVQATETRTRTETVTSDSSRDIISLPLPAFAHEFYKDERMKSLYQKLRLNSTSNDSGFCGSTSNYQI